MLVALGLPTLSLGGLCAPDPEASPCSLDPTACGPGDAWTTMTCPGVDATEPLVVAVGGGDDQFEALSASAPPEVHFGLQGGQHSFVSFRVANARLDVYQRLRITFWMAQGEGCAPPTEPLGQAPAACPLALGRRELVLGSARFPLTLGSSGEVERAGVVMFLSQPPMSATPAVLAAEVEDPCGRRGLGAFAWTPP